MNEQFTNDMKEMDALLSQTADSTHPNEQFVAALEQSLAEAHQEKSKPGWFHFTSKQVFTAFAWTVSLIAFALFMSWAVRMVVPSPTDVPGANTTPGFVCPVTQPNGSQPPYETTVDPNFLGNGQLWTTLWPDGTVYMLPEYQRADGSFEMKWGWWRANSNDRLTIEGHRLDAQVEPLQADIPDGYFDNFQVSGLIFPTTGCWEVTGHAGNASLTFVTDVVFNEATPTPVGTVVDKTVTPIPTNDTNQNAYDFRGAKLILKQALPDSPAQANVYTSQVDQPATVDEARALADQFGIKGDIYTTDGLIYGATDYLITDGKQSLQVHSLNYFNYTADMTKTFNNFVLNNSADATAVISTFLKSHDFDLPVKIVPSNFFGGYIVQPLTPDGFPVEFEPFTAPIMHITLDESGNVLSLNASLINFDSQATGTYGIISAQEALDLLLNDNIQAGKIESFHSASGTTTREWHRKYPDDETITIYGYAYSSPALDATKPPFIQIDGFTASGNTSGIENLPRNTFIEATGKFITTNGIRMFDVNTWNKSPYIQDGIVGTLQRENGQLLFTTDLSEKLIVEPDVPADAPLPFENIFIVGVRKGNTYEWSFMDDRMVSNSGGGGGGGGGLGFYQLNLSGTPVPFPTATAMPAQAIIPAEANTYTVQAGDTLVSIANHFGVSVEQLSQVNNLSDANLIILGQQLIIPNQSNNPNQPPVGREYNGQRGIVTVSIYKSPDGSTRAEYYLAINNHDGLYPSVMLEGDGLDKLQSYNNRPVDIWGKVTHYNQQTNTPVVTVNRFEIPFPDLKFQIIKGTVHPTDVQGKAVYLFTDENGTTYIQMLNNGDVDTNINNGYANQEVIAEALIIPDEIYEGYPTLRVYNSALAISQKNGQPVELTVTSDQPYVSEESSTPIPMEVYTSPDLIIDSVELTYFVSNPYYQVNDPNYNQRSTMLQPVWHFHGHYANGDEFDALIQALKQEYLLPELVPGISPG